MFGAAMAAIVAMVSAARPDPDPVPRREHNRASREVSLRRQIGVGGQLDRPRWGRKLNGVR